MRSRGASTHQLKQLTMLQLLHCNRKWSLYPTDSLVKSVMAEAKEVRDFVKTDHIDSIRLEMARDGELDETWTPIKMCDTRMNLVCDFIKAARKQHDFLMLLRGNAQFQVYYRERSDKEKNRIDEILCRCMDRKRWERMDIVVDSLASHFKAVHKLCCREDFPLSAYPLLVQALRNQINAGLNADKNEFNVVLGEGSRKEVVYMIRDRFNMDGRDPSGRKVGLLDRFHYWCFMVDPFNHEWRSTFKLEPSFAELEKEMVEAYVPLDEDGSTETRDRILKDFQVSYLFFDSLYNSFTLTLTSAFRISTFRTKTG